MKKFLAIVITISTLALTGCSLGWLAQGGSSNGEKGIKPYGSIYDDAEDYANWWCGPCEEVNMKTVPNEPYDIELHYMQDKEFGFTYQVSATYQDYSTSIKPEPTYDSSEFEYLYLKTFLETADLKDITERFGLVFEQDEPGTSGAKFMYYVPSFDIDTEQVLDDSEFDEIMSKVYTELEKFDAKREHYTRSDYCHGVHYTLFAGPSEEYRANGKFHNSARGYYGYKPGT